MENIFSTAKICAYNETQKCDLALNPDITNIMSTSRNEEELKHVWLAWRDAVGPKCRALFEEYVQLSNEAARLNNFTDTSEYWLNGYEDPHFKDKIQNIYEQLKPLYLQLHAYVRFKLRQKYGDVVSETGPIPAHLLGDIMAQNWREIADFTLPFPNVGDNDLTQELIDQNYTAIQIARTAEDFFKSLNLTEMPDSFWEKSIFTKSEDKPMVCMASSWDFSDGKDFRVKLCIHITLTDFTVTHHEMGHIEYYLHYKNLPVKFRVGANDGFHEAVGDLISLSVLSTKHLRQIGLINTDIDHRVDMNNLYKVGLHKIMFLPFSYLMELWRWDIFSGKTKPEDYNCKWWELREKYQGVESPVDRSEEDFDPASKYHIISSTPYLRYFIALILQFQFHRTLCEKAGQYDPISHYSHLHNCDIYQSREAGNALKRMLAMGASRPWPDALEALTGQREMDATAILEYFQPLHEWLKNENKKNGAYVGWESSKRVCTRTKKELET
nr:unnamed protein product [Callosobruchus chinensis]